MKKCSITSAATSVHGTADGSKPPVPAFQGGVAARVLRPDGAVGKQPFMLATKLEVKPSPQFDNARSTGFVSRAAEIGAGQDAARRTQVVIIKEVLGIREERYRHTARSSEATRATAGSAEAATESTAFATAEAAAGSAGTPTLTLSLS